MSTVERIQDNPTLSRYELRFDEGVAFVDYRLQDGIVALLYPEVPRALRGRGLGSELVEGVLKDVRRRGLKVVPRCPFIAAHLVSHPEHRDLLA